jgi:hypothetical protein
MIRWCAYDIVLLGLFQEVNFFMQEGLDREPPNNVHLTLHTSSSLGSFRLLRHEDLVRTPPSGIALPLAHGRLNPFICVFPASLLRYAPHRRVLDIVKIEVTHQQNCLVAIGSV